MAEMKSITDRFWSKVDKDGPTVDHVPGISKCWTWTGYCDPRGYGRIHIGNTSAYAHRVSWRLHFGDIPYDAPCVCHSCDNRRCVRPDHLRVDTQAGNLKERDDKGRGRYLRRLEPRVARGRARKLTADIVRSIRFRLAAGERAVDLAREYGVAKASIYDIRVCSTWRHVH